VGSIKSARRSVKTAEQTSRAAIKTTQASAKTAAKAAQITAKAAQRAAQAARVASKAAVTTLKTIAKAVAATVKALVAAVKGLIAAIAAGGWVAVVIIIVILLFANILCSVFGIFASEEGYDGAPSMPEVVGQINAEFSAKIDSIIDANPHDTLVINNTGSASMVANWDEVLAVYAVLVATEPENPIEVATLDDDKIEKLKTVFWDMNHISFSVDVVEVGTDEETGEPITETVLTITVSYRTAEDMIIQYGFETERAAQVVELLQPEYTELFMRLTGSYVDITLSAAEIAAIMETLPDDLSEARKEVVLTAYSLLGKVKYFWGGKSLVLGWDSRWGTPMKVTADDSPTTGKVRPFGLDCSGFVDWVFYNTSDGDYILGHGGGAIAQYSYCDAIPWSDALPGDLAFYPGCEHIGFVVTNDAGTLTVIHCASGSNNVVMTQHTEGSGFAFIGRPQVFDE
jgi:cell wall-associated NlpC family hydrolase